MSAADPCRYALVTIVSGTLVKRYKRFLADVKLDSNDELVTAHVANPGKMTRYCDPGTRVYLSESTNPTRKLKFSWELAEIRHENLGVDPTFVGVNTSMANKLVKSAIESNVIPTLSGYSNIRTEVSNVYKTDPRSRVDMLLSGHESLPDALVEVKSVTMGLIDEVGSETEAKQRIGIALFPDAVSKRAAQHVENLGKVAAMNKMRAVLVFCVQRSDSICVGPAEHIDKTFSRALQTAIGHGLEVICVQAAWDGKSSFVQLGKMLPFFPSVSECLEYAESVVLAASKSGLPVVGEALVPPTDHVESKQNAGAKRKRKTSQT
eukprot:CAMPEP_0184694100 /NCGR_PEP_ID=MMETSP0313-20130426/2155_1 /TAXON_ID=2792 /ORGANISM="Porphyridium aerugineum, Strain SAG 1380-2" /LENGTH=320 /DNA_ID=CAMNT_0027152329 /DNA_START=43 /DNA_END=1005 /DNA_ORIENTATION=-